MDILRIGTDCSGIESPIIALNMLDIDYSHEFSCDNNKTIKKIIKDNFNPKIFYDNIFDRDLDNMPNIDCYIAGFPCQSFSTAGLNKGFNDKINGTIFFECLKVIENKKPKFFILENVRNLLYHDNGKTFEIILTNLKCLSDYNIYYNILNTKDYGIPQNRSRLYIVGILKDFEKKEFKFPEKIKLDVKLDDFLDNKEVATTDILLPSKQLIVDVKKQKYNIGVDDNYAINLNASLKYATTCKDICPCLQTTCNKIYLTKYNRFLTPNECLKLQCVNNQIVLDCSDNKKYKFIGNAMSVNILCFLFVEIFISIY